MRKNILKISFYVLALLGLEGRAFAENTDIVTVIMPAYNREHEILESIKSVQDQTHSHWRLIVIDDQSSDGTREVVEELAYKDTRIQLLTAPKNAGPASARNLGLSLSATRYIAFLDSDDLWGPEKLEAQLKAMKDQRLPMTYSSYQVIDESGDEISDLIIPSAKSTARDILRNNQMVLSSVMIDLDQVGEVEFPEDAAVEDFALWRILLPRIESAHLVPGAVTYLRKWSGNISASKVRQARERWIHLRQVEKMSFLQSLYFEAEYLAFTGAKYALQFSGVSKTSNCLRWLANR